MIKIFSKRKLILILTKFLTFCLLAILNFNVALASVETDIAKEDLEYEEFEKLTQKKEINDPLEKINRKIYKFNETIDRYFVEHIARAYRFGVPKPARSSIRNFTNNLSLPVSLFNSLLQGKVDNSLATFSTFLINSTIGIFGLFDIAKSKGINFEMEDFGQTLGKYNVGSGTYLMLPLLGPSTTRDFGGFIFDTSINPTGANLLKFGGNDNILDQEIRVYYNSISVIDKREGLIEIIDNVRQDSFDPYSTIRSAYFQQRQSKIKN